MYSNKRKDGTLPKLLYRVLTSTILHITGESAFTSLRISFPIPRSTLRSHWFGHPLSTPPAHTLPV